MMKSKSLQNSLYKLLPVACFPKVPAMGIPAATDSEEKGRNQALLNPCIEISRASFQNGGLLL